MESGETEKAAPWWQSRWVKLALSIGLIGLLLMEVDREKLAEVLWGIDPWWGSAALFVYLLSHVVCVTRWEMMARPLGLQGTYRDFFGAYFTGAFFNLFAPSTVAGDLARTYFLAGTEQRRSLALVSVLAERAIGLVTLVWVAAFAIAIQPEIELPNFIRYGAWTVAPLTVLAWFWVPPLALAMFPGSEKLQRMVNVDLLPYRRDWRLLFRANVASFVFHLLSIGSQAMLARALEIKVSARFVFLFVPIVNVAGMVPISVSGLGVREWGYRYFLAQVGVPTSQAIALGILSSAAVLANGLLGGIVYVVWQNRKKAKAAA